MITLIADLKDPNDTQGRTYREINNAKKHTLKIGQLVEIDSGARMFIVQLSRDCDGTPLYYLCPDKDNTAQERDGFKNVGWYGGYSNDGIKVV